jgi:hypothetical protein
VRAKNKRNSQILKLHKQGVSRSALASKHQVTNGRIAQIVAASSAVDARRAELQGQYGKRPNIAWLGDDTPFDVLILAGSDTHGWAVRILALSKGRKPIRTLGELRNMSDVELFARRGVGAGLFAEIRALCPHVPAQTNETPLRKTSAMRASRSTAGSPRSG